jgi:hypothetical protein
LEYFSFFFLRKVKNIPNFNKFFPFFKVCSIYFKELLSFLHHLVYLHSLIYQSAPLFLLCKKYAARRAKPIFLPGLRPGKKKRREAKALSARLMVTKETDGAASL